MDYMKLLLAADAREIALARIKESAPPGTTSEELAMLYKEKLPGEVAAYIEELTRIVGMFKRPVL